MKIDEKSWLTIPAIVLFQNKNWIIEKLSETEIAITNGWNVDYGYYNSKTNLIAYDNIKFPKYIADKALKLAQKHIHSLYQSSDYELRELKKVPLQKEKFIL